MAQSINLVPQTEKAAQTKTQLIKLSTVISVVILVIVGGIAGYFYYQKATLQNNSAQYQAQIEESRAKIQQLSQIEVSARNLDTKYTTLKAIFDSRFYYSRLLNELNRRTPSSIVIENFSIAPDSRVTLSGVGVDYLSISQFVERLNALLEEEDATHIDGLFTDVTLNSVSLDPQNGSVRYFIIVSVDTTKLKDGK